MHARKMYVCVLDAAGEVQMHRNMTASPAGLSRVISRFGPDLVIAAECIFTWYWIADYCAERGIPFVLCSSLARTAGRSPTGFCTALPCTCERCTE